MAVVDHHQAIADQTATKCIETIKASPEHNEIVTTTDGKNCSKLPLKAYFCVIIEFWKSCPTESKVTSEKCENLRKKLEGRTPMRSTSDRGFRRFNSRVAFAEIF